MLNIAFRTDASSQMGTGHFMRCLTLADELKKKDSHVCFISRNLPPHLRDMLIQRGLEYVLLSIPPISEPIDELEHANWLGTSQTQDAQITIQALSNKSWDWVVVDHYALDERWESLVRVKCKKLMVIDDLADRRHDCDVLLDQNYYADMQTRYLGKVPELCQLILGPRYALLRDEFRVLREKVKVRTGNVQKILVFFGGIDVENYTSLAIQALAEVKGDFQVDIVIGAQNPNQEQLRNACVNNSFICHVQTTRMAELMASADLAIGGGGGATWERCALGLPTIVIVMAKNQRKSAIDLDAFGAIIHLGDAHMIEKDDLLRAIEELLINEKSRTQLSIASMSLMSIQGHNIISKMLTENYA